MKKRMFALLIVMVMMVACCANAFALANDVQPYSAGLVTGGLYPQSGRYVLWGTIRSTKTDNMSITAELRTSSGEFIASAYNDGSGTVVTAQESINLSSGTYYIYLYGTTSTSSPSDVLSVRV